MSETSNVLSRRRLMTSALFLLAIVSAIAGQGVVRSSPALAGGFWLGTLFCLAGHARLCPTLKTELQFQILTFQWKDLLTFLPAILLLLLTAFGKYLQWNPGILWKLWLSGCVLLLKPWEFSLKRLRSVCSNLRLRWSYLGTAGLALCIAALYLYDLRGIPSSVHGDEAEVGLHALALMQRRPLDLFNSSWAWIPTLFYYIPGLFMKLVGDPLVGLRLSTAFCALGSLLFTGLAAGRLWGRRTAMLCVILLAVNHFHFHLGRMGASYIQATFLTAASFYFMVRGLTSVTWRSWILVGLAAALGMMSYYSARLIPLQIFVAYILTALTVKGFWRRGFPGFAFSGIAFLLIVAPLLVHFHQRPETLMGRTNEVSIFSPQSQRHTLASHPGKTPFEIQRMRLKRTLLAFHTQGDSSGQYGYSGRGLLDEVTGVLFMLGLAVCLIYWKQPAYLFPLAWGGLILLTGGLLTIDTPFYPRMAALPVFSLMLAGVGLDHIWRQVEAVPHALIRRLWLIVVILILSGAAGFNYRHYFIGYLRIERPVTPLTQLALRLRQLPPETEVRMFGLPNLGIGHGTIRFLNPDLKGLDVRNAKNYLEDWQPGNAPSLWIFVTGENMQYLPLAQELHPGGRIETIPPEGRTFYTLYFLRDNLQTPAD